MSTAAAKAVRRVHFDLPALPYAEDALEPVISAETLSFHHGKHHKKYIDTLNELLGKTEVRGSTLQDVVRSSQGKLFNNAAQAWNHEFYWHSLAPKFAPPSGSMRRRLEHDFGTYESFIDKFAAVADGQFGSGWAWLVDKNGKLEVVATADADTPMAHGVRCLLGLDVWEHAYYIDYRNQRERYVQAVLEKRLNWAFAEENLNRKS